MKQVALQYKYERNRVNVAFKAELQFSFCCKEALKCVDVFTLI